MSTTFTNTLGNTFTIRINVFAIKNVKEQTGTDIGKLLNEEAAGLKELTEDPIAMCDVLYVLCEDQAKVFGMTDRQFGESMAGDVYEAAVYAFIEAYADFCPAHLRDVLKEGLRMGRQQTESAKIEFQDRLEQLDTPK
ncbi:MAG: hypothetical protein GY753_02105 [Gammaproteobacteria bacterium]|nr:hypothetical protein [Gammaproteobacteria bacterium]